MTHHLMVISPLFPIVMDVPQQAPAAAAGSLHRETEDCSGWGLCHVEQLPWSFIGLMIIVRFLLKCILRRLQVPCWQVARCNRYSPDCVYSV